MDLLVKIFVMIGSGASIGFGVWHFFVPRLWNWYAYIDSHATELVIAVRAINIFFSLSLVLFGIVNILLVYGGKSNRYSIIVMLATTSLLWLTRVFLQIIYPQGSLVSGASGWDVGGIHPDFTVLCDFADNYIGQNTNGKH